MSTFSGFLFLLFIIGLLVLAGALLAAIVVLTPLRRVALRSQRARRLIMLVSALVCFGLVFVLGARIMVVVNYDTITTFSHVPDSTHPGLQDLFSSPEIADHRADIINELWLRQLVPGPLRPSCFQAHELVCGVADAVETPGYALFLVVLALGPALLNLFLVWYFTRPAPPPSTP